ncbi:GNAT family protein [Paenibacillus lautus]|jgi:RimJ/RimL family protein N-acetyltransferase|uniref:N-acetyltransferase n=1 Tax=Paenibacillus lautus TaxID=1401 RepID=A0A385TH64_PAELA|nr:GNAT family protein [Paenibacillus lautus]AYB43910.1 N-acetyltransferase [Paenibacillus lautus]MBY0161493.1 GNAT family N-acetyltransferase [Cytobacillus firmus]MCI1775509.1 GNAT family N-acetyltransferase [Paenibacillus lautus]VTR55174.1 N-acetyltransferase GCN5 [Actinobacillus pleuropneumoniae]
MYIVTERLVIREFEPGDWQDVLQYTSDPLVMFYMPEPVHTEETVKQFLEQNKGGQAHHYAVMLHKEQRVIGHMVFHPCFGEHTYEIGWVFHSAYHGMGYATEAARALLQYGFEALGIHRIIATCQPENTPSYKVMEKLGMRREGCFRQCIPRGDIWWDEYYYAMLESEWRTIS